MQARDHGEVVTGLTAREVRIVRVIQTLLDDSKKEKNHPCPLAPSTMTFMIFSSGVSTFRRGGRRQGRRAFFSLDIINATT